MPVKIIIGAIALAFVFEGVLPFLSPRLFRLSMVRMIQMQDVNLRVTGLVSMVAGVAILYLIRYLG